MDDYLVRSLGREAGLRGFVCVSTQLVEEARRRHATSPTAMVALGRALTTGVSLGALLRVRQRVALKFEGTGPLRKILVEAGSYGTVRGYVAAPEVDLPLANGRYDIVNAIGRAGLLTVVKDLRLKELVKGVVPLANSEVDSDVEAYLEDSEQIPSTIAADVRLHGDGSVALAAGLLIQSIPPHEGAMVAMLKERLQELPPLHALMRERGTPEAVLDLLFTDVNYEVLERRPLIFECSCSRARSQKALVTLGAAELHALLESEGQAWIECPFCHTSYCFSGAELQDLIDHLVD